MKSKRPIKISIDDFYELCEEDYIKNFLYNHINRKKIDRNILKLPNELVGVIKSYVIFSPNCNEELKKIEISNNLILYL